MYVCENKNPDLKRLISKSCLAAILQTAINQLSTPRAILCGSLGPERPFYLRDFSALGAF